MTTVTSLDLLGEGAAPSPAVRRIQRASALLALLFTALVAAYAVFVTALVAGFVTPYAGEHLGIGPRGLLLHLDATPLPAPYVPVSGLPLLQRLAHLPVGALNFAPVLVILWSLRRLFGLYAEGVVFAPENAGFIKAIGAALAVHAVAPLAGVSFLRALHMAVDQAWMHGSSLQELVLGGIVYVIAQVMQLGREIEEDRSQFV